MRTWGEGRGRGTARGVGWLEGVAIDKISAFAVLLRFCDESLFVPGEHDSGS